ncbi:nicotinate-nucleotide adenylyltransferase [Rubrobacter indicoceani]|uniref:nicotinate-nucleotide adenylyltransferase n=1 Tax=Rubrobacter indicoceani TaxID=2051957 RepID=UPI000E5BD0EB|nr:nicotinate-nucleotide adenylyltransferase [Rubrobacter indicoceani]
MRIGIFGGTFDPIHFGHLIIAEQVMDEMRLDRVVFVPGGIPPHKEASSVRASGEDRYEMVKAAIKGNDRFEVDRIEVDAGKAMHTVETVPRLKAASGDRASHDWFFITGADEVSNLLTWREPDRLLEEVVMVAATRPGYDLSKLEHLEMGLRNFDRIFPVECSRVDISATGIRRRLLQGKSVRYMMPDAVFRIIEERRLYVGEMRRENEKSTAEEELSLESLKDMKETSA